MESRIGLTAAQGRWVVEVVGRALFGLALSVAVALIPACGGDDGDAAARDAPAEETIRSPIDGATMVYVPAGSFLMGTSDEDVRRFQRELFPLRDVSRYDNERPQRAVYVDAFYIDRLEVTNELYKRFLRASGYTPKGYLDRPPWNEPQFPAIVLEWEDAAAYAEWAGKRLPTEAEWEKAARGTDGRYWPWGNVWDATRLNANDGTGALDGYAQMAPVGQYERGASPYGALDMAGNAWEWVADWYDPTYYRVAPDRNPRGPATGDGHVLKGGGWAENKDFTRPASRVGGNPGSLLRGFRCAMDAAQAR